MNVMNKTSIWRKSLWVALAVGMTPALVHAVDYKVPSVVGPTKAVQDAVDKCPDNDPSGCRILLQGKSYTLSNTLFIRNKSNITITSASPSIRPVLTFQDKGELAGPDADPDTLAMKPAGWKKWPNSCGTATGGSKDATNPFSTSGIQRNGVVLIQGSHNIVLDGIGIDGVKPIGWGKDGIWNCKDGVFYGNFGINLYLSGKVTVRNSEIKNCFAAFYNFNRNKGGPMAVNNDGDLDTAQLVPNSRYGEMGNHLIEANLIHDNIWGVYVESNWDLGSTWRFNRVYNCHNNQTTYGTFTTTESKNHTGGFMFLKDAVGTPERVYHNTFWQVSALFGQGGWRGNVSTYFYNNLVAEPWMNYTADSTGYANNNFSDAYTGWKNLTWKSTQFMYANTFVPLKSNTNGTGRSWGSSSRLSFQTQGGSYTGNIVFLDGIQYQGQQRGTIPQEWTLEEFDYKTINANKIKHSVVTSNGTQTFNALDTVAVRNVIGGIKDANGILLPIKDTLGRITAANQEDLTPKNNHYLKTVAFQSTNPTDANFLAPVWSNTGVDSTIVGRVMQLGIDGQPTSVGGYAYVSTTSGKPVARGAMQPDGSLAVGMLAVADDQPIVLSATTAVLSFGISTNVGTVSNLRVLRACLYSDIDLSDAGAGKVAGTCKEISTAGFTPALGGNGVVLDFLTDPGYNARFELTIGGTTATGEQIISNTGVWMVHKAQQQFAVSFHKTQSGTKIDTTFAGDLVWMKLQPVKITGVTKPLSPAKIQARPGAYLWKYDAQGKIAQRLDTVWIDKAAKKFRIATILLVDSTKPIMDTIKSYIDLDTLLDNSSTIANVTINTQGMQDASGKTVEASAPLLATLKGETWVQVRFTKAMLGLGVVATGKDNATKAVYQGSGTITVRPGPAYVAQWRDPSSYDVSGDSGTVVPYKAKYKATLDVKDAYGNLVDVALKITAKVDSRNNMTAIIGTGAASVAVLDVPVTGTVQTILTPTTLPVIPTADWFMLQAWVGAGDAAAANTITDSAKVHIQKLKWQFDWNLDSLRHLIKDTVRVTLKLQDGDGVQTAEPGLQAYLSSKNGLAKFYLPGNLNVPVDSVDMSAGSAELLVKSMVESLDDSLYAVNADVAAGQAAVIAPVNFEAPPLPPIDRAWYSDEIGAGTATHFTIKFQKNLENEVAFRLSWPDKNGMMTTVDKTTTANSGTDSVSFDLSGAFAPGVTASNILDLGQIKVEGRDMGYMVFPIQDSVAAILDSAVLVYGTYEDEASSHDVLNVYFSEPVTAAIGSRTVIWNLAKKTGTEELPNFGTFSLSGDGRMGSMDFYQVAGVVEPLPGDSVRIVGAPDNGNIVSLNGVRGAKNSPRVVVKSGPRKPIDPKVNVFLPLDPLLEVQDKRELVALRPAVTSPFEKLLGTKSNVVIFAGSTTLADGDELTVISSGEASVKIPSKGIIGAQGLKIPVNTGTIGNRSSLVVTIYDKYGVYVGKSSAELVGTDLAGIADATGKFDLVPMWDGRSTTGALVNSGVYTMRAVLVHETSQSGVGVVREVMFNVLKNVGIFR